jgi:hypothetical protein
MDFILLNARPQCTEQLYSEIRPALVPKSLKFVIECIVREEIKKNGA